VLLVAWFQTCCAEPPLNRTKATDVDVQVDLEIQGGSVNSERLERALTDCGFMPDSQKIWRWRDKSAPELVVKVEFLADLADVADYITVSFDGCESLGAVNLRGTGFAARDWTLHAITSTINGEQATVQLRVATLPAYLLAKTHAAHAGAPEGLVRHRLRASAQRCRWTIRRVSASRRAICTGPGRCDGNRSWRIVSQLRQCQRARQLRIRDDDGGLHPDLDFDVLSNDAVAAVETFVAALRNGRRS